MHNHFLFRDPIYHVDLQIPNPKAVNNLVGGLNWALVGTELDGSDTTSREGHRR
jgi:hypothetical protein